MPAAIQANGLAPDEPARRTVEVEAFCSWSAWRMKIRSIALASTGLIGLISHGVLNIMCRKFSAYDRSLRGYIMGWPMEYL
jgi:hypothetical protein